MTLQAAVVRRAGRFLTIGCGAGLIPLLLSPPPADCGWRAVCRDASDCNVVGTRELEAGRVAAAEAAFETEVCFAWREGQTRGIVRAHNNLSLLALRHGEPLQARLWAGLALSFDPASRAAQYNARQADEAVARLAPGEGVTGTYWHRWGDSIGHEVAIQELPGNRIRFELQAVGMAGRGPCQAPDFTQGGADGQAALTGRIAVWETKLWEDTCRLRFSFGADEVAIEQEGDFMDCGFGAGVYADGTYRRTSRRPPRFVNASGTASGRMSGPRGEAEVRHAASEGLEGSRSQRPAVSRRLRGRRESGPAGHRHQEQP